MDFGVYNRIHARFKEQYPKPPSRKINEATSLFNDAQVNNCFIMVYQTSDKNILFSQNLCPFCLANQTLIHSTIEGNPIHL